MGVQLCISLNCFFLLTGLERALGKRSLPHVRKDTMILDCWNGSWNFQEIHVPFRMCGRNLSDVYCSDVVLYQESGQSLPTARRPWGAVQLQTGRHQQVSAASVIVQDLPGVCALKVSASCGAKLSVSKHLESGVCFKEIRNFYQS
jgi:hypothetical protein